jgi:hypothetical protein
MSPDDLKADVQFSAIPGPGRDGGTTARDETSSKREGDDMSAPEPAYPALPSHDDLLVLLRAATANARDLLNDAQLLVC